MDELGKQTFQVSGGEEPAPASPAAKAGAPVDNAMQPIGVVL